MSFATVLKRLLKNENKREWMRYKIPKKFSEWCYDHFEDNEGIRVMEQDWDNLFILDACRYDMFDRLRSEFPVDGELTKVKSRGTRTVKFLRNNFPDTYPDTVYVSVNPFVLTVLDDPFYETIYVDATEKDKRAGAVLPETVASNALSAYERNPNKRLIVHFLQPHHPFVGETQIPREFVEDENGVKTKGENPWRLLAKGELTQQKIMEAYEDNLRRTFSAVERLHEEIPGKTVLTSDHGESFGDRAKAFPFKIWGHGGPRIDPLVEVPWYEMEFEERRTIVDTETSEGDVETDDEKLEERLKAIGYME